jgi:hypothetical protein
MALPKTQQELDAFLGISIQGEYMGNYIRVLGTHADFDMEINVNIRDEDFADPDFIQATAARLHEWGLTPKAAPVAVAPAAAHAPAPGYGTPQAGPAQSAAQNGGCPEHGAQYVQKGYQGVGWQCSAYSEVPTAWTKGRAAAGKNGGPDRWYCKFTW